MIAYHLSMPGIGTTLTRALEVKAVDAIYKTLGLRDTHRFLLFGSDDKQFKRLGSDGRLVQYDGVPSEFIVIETEEETEEGTEMYGSWIRDDSVPIIRDTCSGLTVRPLYDRWECTFNITFHTKSSPSKATAMLNRLKLVLNKGQTATFNYGYVYPVSNHVVSLILDIYKKECQALKLMRLNPETLETYFNRIKDNRVVVKGDFDRLFVKETQMNIRLIHTGDPFSTKPDRDDEYGTSTFNTTFKCFYAKPFAFEVQRPVICYNQTFDEDEFGIEYKDDKYVEVIKNLGSQYGWNTLNNHKQFAINLGRLLNGHGYLSFPPEDYNGKIDNTLPNPKLLMTSLLCLDHDNRRELLSLDDFLSDVPFTKTLIDLIKKEREYVCTEGRSLFYIGLIEQYRLVRERDLFMEEDTYVLYSKVDLDFRKTYRLGLFLETDIANLRQDDINRLYEHTIAVVNENSHTKHIVRKLDFDSVEVIFKALNEEKFDFAKHIHLLFKQYNPWNPFLIGTFKFTLSALDY